MGISSKAISYKNRVNKNIVAFYDSADNKEKGMPFIVIPPAYGETKKDSLKLSYFLVKNGFHVLRYDATFHVGESDGDMLDSDFEKMKDDLLSTLDFVEREFKPSVMGIAGTSLGIRVAIKAASQDKRIRFLLGLVPIFDLRSSLKAIYHEDVIGEILAGSYKGKTIDDIMGFEVSVDFALSAIRHKYHDLESTQEDLKNIAVPIAMIAAENDPWINAVDVKKALDSAASLEKKFILIPNTMHQLNENPEAALSALQQCVVLAKQYLLNIRTLPQEVIVPSQEEVSTQWLIEEKRLKILLQKDLEGEKTFWEKYLNKFLLINKSQDYRDFLKEVLTLLEIKQGEKILDAGCGNGHLGAWLIEFFIHHIFKENIAWDKFLPLEYVGLDFVESRLKEGMLKHMNMLRRVYRELCIRERYRIVKYRYVLADLESCLPFPDASFDKVCCNLVISYVKDQGQTTQELLRVLKPGGTIVISSLKPFADLSQIYRDFADQTESNEELEEARKLLSAAGRIKQKENAGIYHFFSEDELKGLLADAPLSNIRTFRAFSNQANVMVGEKQS
jgi:ubiquinone/menaquinone biosynthesis C-methylase UbiE/alpha-beta hydrolase superfamily lysophospholipase